MRALLLVLSAFVIAALPATSAFAGPADPLVGCIAPYPPCTQEPDGQRLCTIIAGNTFCYDPMP